MKLENEKQERFCHGIVDGKNARDAYLEAGFACSRETAKTNASRLLKEEHIQQRIGELKGWRDERIAISRKMFEENLAKEIEKQVDKFVVDINWITAELVDTHKVAKERGDIAGRCRALELLGKSRGMFVDRTENSNVNYAVSDEPMSPEQWAQKYAEQKTDKPH
jgi:hypothetical protein